MAKERTILVMDSQLAQNDYIIEKGTPSDIDALGKLYDDLNGLLQAGTNYPGWIKGVYPTRETAVRGIQKKTLFVLKIKGQTAGTVILNHEPETAYAQAKWGVEADNKDCIVIHTLAVHPKYMKNSVGRNLINFAKRHSAALGMKTIRLDVSIHNTPAIHLYEACGFQYVDTVDLGLNIPDLVWFKLYEILL
jgi:ribosomal protein S18 acetylase RimI-like enzyme